MRVTILVLLLSICTAAMAQAPVSGAGDSDLRALINKVEGGNKKTSLTNDFKSEDESLKKASQVVQKYYQAFLDQDYGAAYDLLTPSYRKIRPKSKFMSQDRIRFESVHITGIEFKEGLCGKVRGSYKGVANAQIGDVRLPIRLFLVKEEGNWYVHLNPYSSMGIQLPQAKKFELPCEF